ncbi:hypothetical protein DDE18_03865 [Nocardioides gansuensis]|uniref:PknH-like extracellular domain-containing protein n=1 Tax=Nocardioides gansuensis TaxID=2138300 RepID=A0A2T8FGC1_9ACTN|nr:hypothetical protein [Nocardioides gansuensis]PVG84744.1 hypothetical protein DDE18_03865 [Nocardioides gansuensis]
MPDPIFDELTRELPQPALPAAEVRRLGDRRRRRTRAATALAAVAAVAAIAAPVALSAGGGGRAIDPVETPSPHEWVITIAEDFPLTDGMALDPAIPAQTGPLDPAEAESLQRLDALLSLHPCGDRQPAWTIEDSLDGAWAAWSDGKSGGEFRTLAVYRDGASAEEALARVRKEVETCPAAEPGAAAIQPVPLASAAGEESFAYVDHYLDKDGPTGMGTVYLLVRVGNALLLHQTYHEGTGQLARVMQAAVDDLQARSEPVVRSLCVYSEDGCDGE